MDDGSDARSRNGSAAQRGSELSRRRRENISNNPEDFTPHSEDRSNDEPPKSQETTAFLAHALHVRSTDPEPPRVASGLCRRRAIAPHTLDPQPPNPSIPPTP